VGTWESELPARARKILRRIALTVATGSITLILTNLTSQPLPWALTLSVLIGGVTLLAQFLIDFEQRQELVEQRLHSLEQSNTAVVRRIEDIVKHEVSRFNDSARLLDRLTGSALQSDSVLKLVRLSADLPEAAPALARDVAQAQVNMTVSVLEQLSHGGEINYDGEDRDWLLTLTNHATLGSAFALRCDEMVRTTGAYRACRPLASEPKLSAASSKRGRRFVS
jgi:hypothetical protein